MLIDEDDDMFLEDDEPYVPPSRRGRRKRQRKIGLKSHKQGGLFPRLLPRISLPSSLEWYDYIMIPLLVVIAIMIVLNFSSVMEFFFVLTVRVLSLGFELLTFHIIIAIIIAIIKRSKW